MGSESFWAHPTSLVIPKNINTVFKERSIVSQISSVGVSNLEIS